MATDYSGRRGYRLFQPFCFTPEIREFLGAQDALLQRLSRNRHRLIEIGCGKAEHGAWAIRRNVRYLGIDPSKAYLDVALRKMKLSAHGQFELVHAGIEDLPTLLQDEPQSLARDSIALVPFNCLGNILQITEAVAALADLPIMHIVAVFHDEPQVTRARKRYYANAGYRTRARRTRQGVCFSAGRTLNTVGFSINFLRTLWINAGLKPKIIRLGNVGLAVVCDPYRKESTKRQRSTAAATST